MTNTYFNLLLWVVVGCLIGATVYYAFFPPTQVNSSPIQLTNLTNSTNIIIPSPVTALNIVIINPNNCNQCNSSIDLLNQLQTQTGAFHLSLNTPTILTQDSVQAQALISKYNISILPTLILTSNGSLNTTFVSLWQQRLGTSEPDGALIFRFVPLPYYSITNHSVVGLVQGIAIRATGCSDCFDPSLFFTSLTSTSVGMIFSNITILDRTDQSALALIAQYNVTNLPVLFLSKDASAYDVFNQKILALGEIQGDWFVLKSAFPPYMDLANNNSIRGHVSSIEIINSSCKDCFNVSGLSDYIVRSSGIVIVNTSVLEANSSAAKVLFSKYSIKYIPTLIYSPDASYYPGFDSGWLGTNSTIEKDGFYVLRAQPYLNLTYQNVSG